jgi:hypothetical protein
MLIKRSDIRISKWREAIRLICFAVLGVGLTLFFPSAQLFGQLSGSPSASPVNGPTQATHVLGLEHVKRGAKGSLVVEDQTLRFESGASTATIRIPSIQNVFTAEESQEMLRGKTGIVVEAAMPYESSRVVSLLASRKIDDLTLEYRDSNGALHGVIFTLPKGQAPALKRLLVAHGAHAGTPPRYISKP